MPETAHPTLPTADPSAPTVLDAPQPPCGPLWLVFCVMACSAFAALLGRLAPFAVAASPARRHDPNSPAAPNDHPFAFLLQLIAIDWFRRFRSTPATPEQLRRRSRLARAVLSQPPAPVVPCDRPGQPPVAGVFAPAFVRQLASTPDAPLSLTPTSFLGACFASLATPARSALSPRNRAVFADGPLPARATPHFTLIGSGIAYSACRISHAALEYSVCRIPHSAFPPAPV